MARGRPPDLAPDVTDIDLMPEAYRPVARALLSLAEGLERLRGAPDPAVSVVLRRRLSGWWLIAWDGHTDVPLADVPHIYLPEADRAR